MSEGAKPQLVDLFKALADSNRLKIVSLLTRRSYSVEELAGMLGLGASTVSHHLARLAEVGLVSARTLSYYNLYSLHREVLEEMARLLLSKDLFPQAAGEVDMLAYDRKVVNGYLLPDGHLKAIPSQRKKREVVLRYILQAFTPGVQYTERQVNEILAKYHEDTALLRRELVGYHLLGRDTAGNAYWRIIEPSTGGA